jgi:non-specific serine/threonine protein kinase
MDRGINPPGSENCLPVGTRLAEFEITGVVGEGGFGIVYLAFDHSLERTVALKEYMPSVLAARYADGHIDVRAPRHESAFQAGLRSFINEARLLARFDHPALVKVYRFWEQHGTAYMAMRYYEGKTFKSVAREAEAEGEPLDEAALRAILRPIMEALGALYGLNILHRDISPENIIIQPNGQAVLLDFGAARQIVSGMNPALTVILKPGYAPVEQYANDDTMQQGPWTDIYSLAAVMYYAITGSAPATAVGRMLHDPLEPLAGSGRIGYSDQFLAAIDKALAVRPNGRPQTLAGLAARMGGEMMEPGTGAHAAVLTEPPRPAGSNATGNALTQFAAHLRGTDGKRTLAAVGAAGVLLLATAGYWLTHHSGTTAAANAPPAATPAALPVAVTASKHASLSAAATISEQEQIVSWEAASKELTAAHQHKAAHPAAPAASTAGAVAPAKAASKPAAPAKKTGRVSLAIQPWGTITVDGVAKGVSPPLKTLTLPAGKHEIKVVNPAFPPYSATVTVGADAAVTVTRNFANPQ